jgi:hypothetical protein
MDVCMNELKYIPFGGGAEGVPIQYGEQNVEHYFLCLCLKVLSELGVGMFW